MTNLLTPLHLIFYLFAAIAVSSALIVITVRNPVRSVLSLVVTFFAMAGIWMLLHAEFLSLILLLVYVGAVMTLFLFVVMMLHIETEYKHTGFIRFLPLGMAVVIVLTALIIIGLGPDYFAHLQMPLSVKPQNYNNVAAIGSLLYTDYAYPFEVAGVVLLTAMIAAITLTHRGPLRRKVQNISEQIAVRPEERVRLIKMPSEPKRKS
jgi:NADH-quinone oxidoreductase subunit J